MLLIQQLRVVVVTVVQSPRAAKALNTKAPKRELNHKRQT